MSLMSILKFGVIFEAQSMISRAVRQDLKRTEGLLRAFDRVVGTGRSERVLNPRTGVRFEATEKTMAPMMRAWLRDFVDDRLVPFIQTSVAAIGAGMFTAAISQSAVLERALSRVQVTTELAAASMEKMRRGLLDVSNEVGKSADKLAAVVEVAGQAGLGERLGVGGLTKFSKGVAMLAETSKLGITDTANMVVQIVDQLQIIERFGEEGLMPFLSTVQAIGRASVSGTGEVLRFTTALLPLRNVTGFTESEILGLAGAAKSFGNATSELLRSQFGVNFFKKAILNTQLFTGVLGKSTQAIHDLLRNDPQEFLIQMLEGLRNLRSDPIKFKLTLHELGLDPIRLEPMLTGASLQVDKIRRLTKEARKSLLVGAEGLSQDFEKMMANLSGQFQRFGEITKNVFEVLGRPLIRPLTMLLEAVNALLGNFVKFLDTPVGQFMSFFFLLETFRAMFHVLVKVTDVIPGLRLIRDLMSGVFDTSLQLGKVFQGGFGQFIVARSLSSMFPDAIKFAAVFRQRIIRPGARAFDILFFGVVQATKKSIRDVRAIFASAFAAFFTANTYSRFRQLGDRVLVIFKHLRIAAVNTIKDIVSTVRSGIGGILSLISRNIRSRLLAVGIVIAPMMAAARSAISSMASFARVTLSAAVASASRSIRARLAGIGLTVWPILRGIRAQLLGAGIFLTPLARRIASLLQRTRSMIWSALAPLRGPLIGFMAGGANLGFISRWFSGARATTGAFLSWAFDRVRAFLARIALMATVQAQAARRAAVRAMGAGGRAAQTASSRFMGSIFGRQFAAAFVAFGGRAQFAAIGKHMAAIGQAASKTIAPAFGLAFAAVSRNFGSVFAKLGAHSLFQPGVFGASILAAWKAFELTTLGIATKLIVMGYVVDKTLIPAFSRLWQIGSNFFIALTSWMQTGNVGVLRFQKLIDDKVFNVFMATITIVAKLRQAFSKVFDIDLSGMSPLEAFGTMLVKILESAISLVDRIVGGVMNLMEVISPFAKLLQFILDAVSFVVGGAFTIGGGILKGITSFFGGVGSGIGSIVDYLTGVAPVPVGLAPGAGPGATVPLHAQPIAPTQVGPTAAAMLKAILAEFAEKTPQNLPPVLGEVRMAVENKVMVDGREVARADANARKEVAANRGIPAGVGGGGP